LKLYNFRIIPSQLKYKSAPSVDQNIVLSLDNTQKVGIEYDRIRTLNLAEIYDQERQESTIFRPTFNINFLYLNAYTGTTNYVPFRNNLYFTEPEISALNGVWVGYPQYYEFDFYRPNVEDGHIDYKSKSAFTYNWTYYLSYAYNNNYDKSLQHNLNNSSLVWQAKRGIPFRVRPTNINGDRLISFECISPHGLQVSESVELSFGYGPTNDKVFEVYSLGNGLLGSEATVFNVYNIGFTGNTFSNGKTGTFKRVTNPDNINETRSKYYVREHRILTNLEDLIITKAGFEKNAFLEKSKIVLSSITPDLKTRITKRSSSNTYTVTSSKDIDLGVLLDNQKRPITELYLTIVNKGYSGYFNKPQTNSAIKQGWLFNINTTTTPYWSDTNTSVYTDIPVSSYTLTDISGNTKTFYYNQNLKEGDILLGAFCEWNDYDQTERVISEYYHKINFNQDIFQTNDTPTENSNGYYYSPHQPMKIRDFSDTIETGDINNIDQVPGYSFYSESDQEFRWKDLYTYGFIDELGNGVDYPYLNNTHYPFTNVIFRLLPEGLDSNGNLLGINIPIKPLIDGCE
jgi:hypothetical protein